MTDTRIEELAEVFTAPIIVFPPADKTLIPEWLLHDIRISRLLKLVRDREREIATDEEALAYIMTASLANPLDHDFVTIYMFLFKKIVGRKADVSKLEFLNDVPEELDSYLKSQLDDLKRWIRKQQKKRVGN